MSNKPLYIKPVKCPLGCCEEWTIFSEESKDFAYEIGQYDTAKKIVLYFNGEIPGSELSDPQYSLTGKISIHLLQFLLNRG